MSARRPTPPQAAPRGLRGGALLGGIVALLLLLLAARVAVLLAAEAAVPAAPERSAPAAPATKAALTRLPPPPTAPAAETEADPRLLAELARREAVLERRERALATRTVQVEAAEKLARQEIAELTRLRVQLEGVLNREKKGADADLAVLVGLYRNMKPQQAAAVLAKLDPPSAAAILEKLDTREAGPIVAAMDPNAALAVTQALEKRRAVFRR